MLAILDHPAVRERAAGITVDEYHRAFADRDKAPYELIRGAIIQKMPQSSLHASIIACLRAHAELTLPAGFCIREEKPLTFSDSEPEPDLAIVAGTWQQFTREHPHTAELVIEVAVTSEALDRLKGEIYAEAGVREYWLVLPDERVMERYTEPNGSVYQHKEQVAFDNSLPSTVFPNLRFPPVNLPGGQ